MGKPSFGNQSRIFLLGTAKGSPPYSFFLAEETEKWLQEVFPNTHFLLEMSLQNVDLCQKESFWLVLGINYLLSLPGLSVGVVLDASDCRSNRAALNGSLIYKTRHLD